jgi:hypothetical protein
MKKRLAFAAFAFLAALPAHALEPSIVNQLNALAPEERREQRCDMEAMKRIEEDTKSFLPDKVIAYTFQDPVRTQRAIEAPGAVFRSRGDWYRLQYRCETGTKGLKVLSFRYKIGERIPREEWGQHYLYE